MSVRCPFSFTPQKYTVDEKTRKDGLMLAH
jgi:hypothetical protein